MNDVRPAASRSPTTTVYLGDLRDRVGAASAAAGVGPSTWLRALALRELSASSVSDGDNAAASSAEPVERAVYRAWLDAGLTAKLDAITERSGFSTRAAALRAVLEGVNVGGGAGASLSEAVRAVGLSNHHLIAIGRNINQIAKVLQGAGRVLTADRMALDDAVHAIHKHVEVAAALVGELRPMFKTEKP